MHVSGRFSWLVLPTALGVCSALTAHPQGGSPPSSKQPDVQSSQGIKPPVPRPPGTGLTALPSLYKGLPLPPEGEILEIPTGAKDRYSVAPYRLVAEPYSNRKEVADVELSVNDERPAAEMPQIVSVNAAAQGEATIILPLMDPQTGTTFERRLTVLVVDQISPAFREHMKATIKRLFPSVSVDIVVANGRTVLLTGAVDRAELVEVLVEFVRSSLNNVQRPSGQAGGGVEVVNALRVVDAMQVQLKVVFASVNRTKLRELGLSWRWEDLSGPLTGNLAVQLPGNPGPAATMPFFVSRAGVFSYAGFLQALENHGLGKILAEPTVTAMSGTPAFFNAGQNFPIVSPGATVLGGGGGQVGGGGGVTFVPIGTNLRYVPTVLGNGRIRLEVRPEVSEFVRDVPTPGGGTAPVVQQRVVETTVELESGQTFILAGLTRQQAAVAVNKLPFIGNLPLVGWAFQQKNYRQDEEELIIMVTPYFADALNEAPCKLPGRESRIPNDVEFYLGSKFEPPCFKDPYVGDWKKDWQPPTVLPVPPYDNRGRPDSAFLYPHEHHKLVQKVGHVAPAVGAPMGPVGSPPPQVAPPTQATPGQPTAEPVKPVKPAKKSASTGVKKTSATMEQGELADDVAMPSPTMHVALPPMDDEVEQPVARVERKRSTRSEAGDGAAKTTAAAHTLPMKSAQASKSSASQARGGKILSLIPKDQPANDGEVNAEWKAPEWKAPEK
jgi:Flp pilus assembly secretin CpaC